MATSNGQVFISICYNKHQKKPPIYDRPVVAPTPQYHTKYQYSLASTEMQVEPGQRSWELGKHFHWFSWLNVAWLVASHLKRVENAFAAWLMATSAIESLFHYLSLTLSFLLPISLSLSHTFSCACLFARINDVIQLKWNFHI